MLSMIADKVIATFAEDKLRYTHTHHKLKQQSWLPIYRHSTTFVYRLGSTEEQNEKLVLEEIWSS